MSVLLVDYGMGNLASARRSLEECGASVVLCDDPCASHTAERIVIPGVGAFGQAMRRLRERGWCEALREAAQQHVPILGICLGMQLLADEGDEGGITKGLGLIPGRIQRLVSVTPAERVPHVGWNEVYAVDGAQLFNGIKPGSDFFFVHSYRFVPDDPAAIVATTPYCGGFASAVQLGRVAGTQFHPEKSSRVGFQLIRNFLRA
jgi:glutamine amidotransferase